MNGRSPNEILYLQHSQKELNARNRKKSGYAVYMSWFYHDFGNMSTEEKKECMIEEGLHHADDYDDDDSIMSDPPITTSHTMRLCGIHWRRMGIIKQQAWKDRAAIVNQLPVLGAFSSLPQELETNTDQLIIKSLTLEYDRLISYLHNGLKMTQPFTESIKEKTFGKERFELGSQLFRSFFLNYLLKLTFFGSNFSKLCPNEIVYRTNKSIVVHISSQKRIVELFTHNGVCAFEYTSDGNNVGERKRYTCGGKVVVKENRGKCLECIGYVLDEGDGKLNIKLENGEAAKMIKPKIDEYGNWVYHHHNDDEQYQIVQYWPIRLKLLNSGYVHMTLNKFKLSDDDNIII